MRSTGDYYIKENTAEFDRGGDARRRSGCYLLNFQQCLHSFGLTGLLLFSCVLFVKKKKEYPMWYCLFSLKP
jgi:hypothetical protein